MENVVGSGVGQNLAHPRRIIEGTGLQLDAVKQVRHMAGAPLRKSQPDHIDVSLSQKVLGQEAAGKSRNTGDESTHAASPLRFCPS